MQCLKFESKLNVSHETLWQWITSIHGISTELKPYLGMSVPKGIRSLSDVKFIPNQVLFRSRVYLFNFVPIDWSDLTLSELDEMSGFVEISPMRTMKNWKHERRIYKNSDGSMTLSDQLNFEPKFLKTLTISIVRRLFIHRHRVLMSVFG